MSPRPTHAPTLAAPATISGALWGIGIGAVIVLDDLLQDDREAECHEDLVSVRALVEVLDQAAFHRDPDQGHDYYGQRDRNWHGVIDYGVAGCVAEPDFYVGNHFRRGRKAKARVLGGHFLADLQDLVRRDRAEGAEHKQRAMGKVDHTQCAENQCQPQGDQRIGAALVETVENLKKNSVHCIYPHCKTKREPPSLKQARPSAAPILIIISGSA